ncbi:MAG TPA: RidA family protein [Pseudonocardia sp.]|nr:RidA family protein [Pseudonocardia sp.]
MTITRQHVIDRDAAEAVSAPIISYVVTHGDVVYLSGVISDPRNPGPDVQSQTREVLHRIDELLADAGTDKSKLLSAQVWLRDMSTFSAHNEVWNEWVDPANPPVRACIQAQLVLPTLLVEIKVTAAR